MSVVFYGHACLKALSGNGAVLMDPWLSREGAFFGTWFQFPENAHLLEEALAGVTDICVSHNHADHFDPAALRRACRDERVRLHIPRYQTDWFLKRIARLVPELRARFVEHAAWERFQAGSCEIFFVPEEAPGAVDSAIVVRAEGKTLVNLNDSRLSTDQLKRIAAESGPIEWLALQCSGASEYPVCYTYAADDMKARRARKRREKFELCRQIIDLIAPRRVLLFAGPPALLQPEHAPLLTADDSVFPDALAALRDLERARPDIAAKSYLLNAGEPLEDRFLWPSADLAAERLAPYARKDEYLRSYRERRAAELAFDPGALPPEDKVLAHFARMARLSPYVSRSIGGEVEFRVAGRDGTRAYAADFVAQEARAGAAKDPLYVLTVPASIFAEILTGAATWDDAFLSLRMTFEERTDRFILHLKTLLRYMDPSLLAAVETYEKHLSGEDRDMPMIEVECAGRRYRIQRACPHAGTDLEHQGRVSPDGTIVCLAHRFRFDLATGECLNARGYRLKTEPAGESAPGKAVK